MTGSKLFNQTTPVSESYVFVDSDMFERSEDFGVSGIATDTEKLSETEGIQATDRSNVTDTLSISGGFSVSESMARSDHWSDSSLLSDSNRFDASGIPSGSGRWNYSSHITMSDSITGTDAFLPSLDLDQTVNFSDSDPFDGSAEANLKDTIPLSKTSRGWTETGGGYSMTDDLSLSEDFVTGNLSDSDPLVPSQQFSTTDQFSDTMPGGLDGFNLTEHWTESQVFQPSVEFVAVIMWRDLKSVWGYLAAIMVLTAFGTGLMVRSLYLSQKLEWGDEMEDSESMFYSDEGEDSSSGSDTGSSEDSSDDESDDEEGKKSDGGEEGKKSSGGGL
jgi:hypothetical protein